MSELAGYTEKELIKEIQALEKKAQTVAKR